MGNDGDLHGTRGGHSREETGHMIPRHRPPFGVGTVLATTLSTANTVSVERVEEAYAAEFGLYAVLLPSARAGICWALRAVVNPDTSVIGPAYTCNVVHEAMARSGGKLRLIDAGINTFLIDPARLASETCDNCAVVLSENYGYSYEPYAENDSVSVAPRLRIFDASMTIPTIQSFERVLGNDCVIFSFGIGKCIYSGFGGIGLTKDKNLADEIRNRRDAHLRKETLLLLIMRGAEIGLRTMAHTRSLYGLLYKFRRPPSDLETFPSAWSGDELISKEWYLPSTYLDRRLALHNLQHRTELNERRINLAARYHRNLAGAAGVISPSLAPYAMSHYTIRVPSELRDGIQAALWRLGVDAGTLFRSPSYISMNWYPNARRISGEVLNLPLDANLNNEDVDYICDCVIRCVSQIRATSREIT
jgi:dTDP-4-amino-4,6-dideoxygalactose transaminase